jgi:hypothetical protein
MRRVWLERLHKGYEQDVRELQHAYEVQLMEA